MLSIAVAAIRIDRETERAVAETAERLSFDLDTQALARWFCGSRAWARCQIPIEDLLRFCDWILSGRGSKLENR